MNERCPNFASKNYRKYVIIAGLLESTFQSYKKLTSHFYQYFFNYRLIFTFAKFLFAVNYLSKYNIAFRSLSDGTHNYHFTIDDAFFKHFEESEISRANVEIDVTLEKTSKLLTLTFDISGIVTIDCDKCLDELELEVEYNDLLYVKLGDKSSDITDVDDTIILANTENEIALAQHLYEYIHLSLPYRRVHEEDENGNSSCNPEMLKKLEEYLLPEDEIADPRWDALKNITITNN